MSNDKDYSDRSESDGGGATPVRLGSPRRGRKLKKKRRGEYSPFEAPLRASPWKFTEPQILRSQRLEGAGGWKGS